MKNRDANPNVAPDRKEYRRGRHLTATKVYTINHESKFLIVTNVPAINVSQKLEDLFMQHGLVKEFRLIPSYTQTEEFTQAYRVEYHDIGNAKMARRALDDLVFFTKPLHVRFAPELESVADTQRKLQDHLRAAYVKLNLRPDHPFLPQ